MIVSGKIPRMGFPSNHIKSIYNKLGLDYGFIDGSNILEEFTPEDENILLPTGSSGTIVFEKNTIFNFLNYLGDNVLMSEIKINKFQDILSNFPEFEVFYNYQDKINLDGLTEVGKQLKVFNFFINSVFLYNHNINPEIIEEVKKTWANTIKYAGGTSKFYITTKDSLGQEFSGTRKIKRNEPLKQEALKYPLNDSLISDKVGFNSGETIYIDFNEENQLSSINFSLTIEGGLPTALADSISNVTTISSNIQKSLYNEIINT